MTLEEADDTNIITVWIPLCDVDAESGCLEVLADCHKGGLLAHVKNAAGVTTIDPATLNALARDREAVACAMKRGAAPARRAVLVCRGDAAAATWIFLR